MPRFLIAPSVVSPKGLCRVVDMLRFLRSVAIGCASLACVLGVVDVVLAQDGAAVAPAAQQEVFGPAPAAGSEQPTLFGSLVSMLPMLAVCYLIFYFMVIKPQESKVKKHKSLLESLKRGDSVVTSGGIMGKVAGIEKDCVLLEIAQNVKIKVELAHVLKRAGDDAKAEAA
jgi:preprotein translocase subunit YajC